jgi:GWxTD domain-containing protein
MQAKVTKFLFLLLCVLLTLGLFSCGFSRKVALDPRSQDFYEKARLVMTGQEKNIFNHLPDRESREEFIKEFWAKRDPDPGTEENEFKQEFLQRIEYANSYFREGIPGWKTDRGRIYIYLGPPDRIEQRPYINDPSIKGLIWWGYYEYRLGLEFVDRVGDGSYTLNQQISPYGNLLQVIERAKFGQILGGETGFKNRFVDFKVSFNREKREILVSIPVADLTFTEEDKLLKASFEFEFYIYQKKDAKKYKFQDVKYFEKPEDEILQLKEITFTFPYELKPGNYYFDVIIIVKPDGGKARKIFEIKV